MEFAAGQVVPGTAVNTTPLSPKVVSRDPSVASLTRAIFWTIVVVVFCFLPLPDVVVSATCW